MIRRMRFGALLLLLALLGSPPVLGDDEETDKEIATAKATYNAAIEKARQALLDAFDAKILAVRNAKISDQAKVLRLETLKTEKEAFEESSDLPASKDMVLALGRYKDAIKAASTPYDRTLAKVIAALIKAEKDNQVGPLLAERKRLAYPELIGTWEIRDPSGMNLGGTQTITIDASPKNGNWHITVKSDWALLRGNFVAEEITFRKGILAFKLALVTRNETITKTGSKMELKAINGKLAVSQHNLGGLGGPTNSLFVRVKDEGALDDSPLPKKGKTPPTKSNKTDPAKTPPERTKPKNPDR